MPTYYTQNGDIIKNPTAYSKTGAPMYKTQYGGSYEPGPNINKDTYIYKLELEKGKKYIGKTTDINKRMDQHFSGNGSQVTKKFKPIEGEVIYVCPGFISDQVEQEHTEDNISTHGYQNVRGGKYVNSKTLHTNQLSIQKKSYQKKPYQKKPYQKKSNTIKCYRCGRSGHYATSCYAKTNKQGNYLDDSDDY